MAGTQLEPACKIQLDVFRHVDGRFIFCFQRAFQRFSRGNVFAAAVLRPLVVGAHSVMIGSLFAGTEESPGETILYQGRTYKIYRGMGSIDAMKEGSSDRYFQEKTKKLVPEGIVGRVPYRGPVMDAVYQLMGGLRSGMGYVGAKTLDDLFQNTTFCEISAAGLRESHVHDVVITKEAPNYRIEN